MPGEHIDLEKSNSYYLRNGSIYYSPSGNWFELGYNKCEADKSSFEVLSESIAKDKSNIYSGYEPQNVDYESFYIDKNGVPKDKQYVYEGIDNLTPIEILGLDVKSFEYLGKGRYIKYGWAKDKNNYYHRGVKSRLDYNTIMFVGDNFVYDKDSIYSYSDNGLESLIKLNSNPIEITPEYLYYNKKLYNRGQKGKINIITSGKIKTKRILNDYVITINDTTIYYGQKKSFVDSKTLTEVKDSKLGQFVKYYKDNRNVYYDMEIIEEANPQTFEFLEFCYSRDDKNVYWKLNKLDGVDPFTFRKDKNNFLEWKDKNENRFNSDGERIKN